jgi:FMN phosphatase YigB (HAD superfamily)
MPSRLKGIFFDEGGTLILGVSRAYDSLSKEVNRRYGLEGFREAFDKEFEEVFSKRSKDGHKFYSLREINAEAIQLALSRFVKNATSEAAQSLNDFFIAKLERVLYPHPEATEVLTKLKEMNFLLGVVSDHDTKLLYGELEKAGLLGFLDLIVSSRKLRRISRLQSPFYWLFTKPNLRLIKLCMLETTTK